MILLYHGVTDVEFGEGQSVDGFEKQMRFLNENYQVIPYNAFTLNSPNSKQVVLTFDDGFKNNFLNVVPILKKYNLPATFFISNRHSENKKYLWFAYFFALKKYFNLDGFEFRGDYYDMSLDNRARSIESIKNSLIRERPYPSAMYNAIDYELPALESFMTPYIINETVAGLNEEEIKEISDNDLFDIGVHTVDHPYLTQCKNSEIISQINGNKTFLESVSNKKIDVIGYPSGDYNSTVIKYCKEASLIYGHAVKPSYNKEKRYEYERIGIYGDSLFKMVIKVRYGLFLRKFLNVG